MLFDYISCLFGMIKIIVFKIIYPKRIMFKTIPKMNYSFKIAIKKKARLKIEPKFRTRNNVSFRIYDNAEVIIGKNSFLNDGCSINARKRIEIGENFKAGQNLLIFDNDHDYKNNMDNYICNEVVIGDNVWVGANCTILKGVHIGSNSVIAANTLINKNIPENSVVYNEKRIKTINKMKGRLQ